MDLEIARQVEEQRAQIVTSAREQALEQHQLELRQRDIKIERMQARITELGEAAEAASSGLIGEALEREIEDVLTERFRSDRIQPTTSGQKGAERDADGCLRPGRASWEDPLESKRRGTGATTGSRS